MHTTIIKNDEPYSYIFLTMDLQNGEVYASLKDFKPGTKVTFFVDHLMPYEDVTVDWSGSLELRIKTNIIPSACLIISDETTFQYCHSPYDGAYSS